jgi:hypothetical protein
LSDQGIVITDPPATREDIQGIVIAVIRGKSKPVLIEGWMWRLVNYSIARYSLFGLRVADILSRHKSLTGFTGCLSALSRFPIGVAIKIAVALTANRGGLC